MMNYFRKLKLAFIIFPVFLVFSCGFGNGKKIEASGTIEITETNVSAKNNETVKELMVNEGDLVKENDLIAEINHTTLDLQLAQAKSNYENAEADFKRKKEIYLSGNTNLKDKEDAENRYINAKSAYEIYKKQIDDCFIKSPLTGIVTHKLIEKGEFVNIGTPVYSISKIDPVNITIYVTEIELARVKTGQTAKIKIDAFPKKSYIGKVIYISPNAEFTPKNIQTKDERVKQVFGVKIEVPNPEGILKPGMPADAVLE